MTYLRKQCIQNIGFYCRYQRVILPSVPMFKTTGRALLNTFGIYYLFWELIETQIKDIKIIL